MWEMGEIEVRGTKVKYWVKHFEDVSMFGIDGGRISKMECRIENERILSYERGWEMKPRTAIAKLAFATLKEKFN